MARIYIQAILCALVCILCLHLATAQNRDLLQRTLPTAPPIPSLPGAPPAKAPAPSANTTSGNKTSAGSLIDGVDKPTTTTIDATTSTQVPSGPDLPLPGSVDVIVIGAGISGLAAARILHDLGYTTIILEASPRLGKPHQHMVLRPAALYLSN
jgi:hypothetical protein